MAVVTKIATAAHQDAAVIMAVLDGRSGQEIADALLLAMVLHIEQLPTDHHHELASGVAMALLANFSEQKPSQG